MANPNVQTTNQTATPDTFAPIQTNSQTPPSALNQKSSPTKKSLVENPQNSVSEIMYFCGARTKKGTPCSRRVKGGGRCWQHTGQPAILPSEKLIASH